MKSKLFKYLTSFLVGGGLFCLYLFTRKFPAQEATENYLLLADAATIPGLLFTMFGAFIWAASLGATDGFSYLIARVAGSLFPGGRGQKDVTYAEHVEKRKKKYAKSKGRGVLLVTGLAYLAIAFVFIALFYLG